MEHIYSISRDHSLVKWSQNGQRLQILSNIHSDWIINLRPVPNLPFLVTNSRDGSVKVRYTVIGQSDGLFVLWSPTDFLKTEFSHFFSGLGRRKNDPER